MRGKERRNHGTNVCGGITPAYAGKSGCCHHLVIFVEDHPRVCGEKEQREKSSLCQKGSPPRMRGKVRAKLAFARYSGITPAYAGKSQTYCFRSFLPGDHPRVCGEKGSLTRVCLVELGSPPRMRGKGWVVAVAVAFLGITPAYAGKSAAKEFACKDGRDHPRVCGEKVCVHPVPVCALGSPPRMRGKVIRSWIMRIWTRITPAYAGKRGDVNTYEKIQRDHPRVCGEKCCVGFAHGHRLGSPPRMRGKVLPPSKIAFFPGITPAYAGKSLSHIHLLTICQDHPRVCGEKRLIVFVFRAVTGSPPRMRGKVVGVSCSTYFCGITPAYAGKSLFRYSFGSSFRDHPRVCGEKTLMRLVRFAVLGSPPRMRGKGMGMMRFLPASGITPAYAGKRACYLTR